MDAAAQRKRLGAWYTPEPLVATIVDAVVTPEFVRSRTSSGQPLRVLDPACGDGRFLAAVADRVRSLGSTVEVHGVDVDGATVTAAQEAVPGAVIRHADALALDWRDARFDLVIGNPPFLSQLSRHTTRGGASSRGGGPYADAAAEFLALGAELVEPDGGRLAFVLPQSLLAARDASAIRRRIDERAAMVWSWWSGDRVFDAQVLTCAVAFEFGSAGQREDWARVVTERSGVPPMPGAVSSAGRLGDRATLNANFRDEYYGLVPAVGDHAGGPPLVTSGLIDPGRSMWGERPVTFARQRVTAPRVALDRLTPWMREWARRRLVPKVLVANQTAIVEAVCDPGGEWLPAVPVVSVYPSGAHWDDPPIADRRALAAAAWELAAVLTSPVASTWLWHRCAGTGLGPRSIRLSPQAVADLPWPAGPLAGAVAALRDGDVRSCGRLVEESFGLDPDDGRTAWWADRLDRIERRHRSSTR